MTFGLLAALAGALFAATPARQSPPHATPREAFDRGRTAFGRAEYRRAIEILHPLLYPEVLLDSEGEVVQAHRMLGVAYLYQNQSDEARREFHKLLELRPDYRFDPLLDPQQVVDAFNGVVKEEETEIASFEARRRQRDQELLARRLREERLRPPVTTILRYEHHPYGLNFVPFGVGQFQSGQRRKGWLFLGVEAGLGAVSIGAFATNLALYGLHPHRKCLVQEPIDSNGLSETCPPDKIDHSQEDTSSALLRVQLVTGALFFATAIWGVVDALRHYRREVLLESGAAEAVPAAAPTFRLGLMPFGLSGSFSF
ncbi:MAG TPA: tetratricopeptide repeat protein [Polyangia bacterium]|nr:tetratricopeptide repeat protein [Polyangia bacterium]